MNMDLIQKYVGLTRCKRELNDQLGKVQDELNAIEPIILEDMLAGQVQSMSACGATVYQQRQFTARIKPDMDRAAVLREFMEAGHGELCSLSWQTLRAMVREFSESGEPLPDVIERTCEIGDERVLRCRFS